MHASHMLPPPPPPPGSTDAEVTSFQSSNSSNLYPGQQQQQQHIVPPPPDLKAVVDKLADYVSRNGEEFEEQVKRKNDPRFDFLKIDNLYFPYYMYKKQHFIREIAMQKAKEEKGWSLVDLLSSFLLSTLKYQFSSFVLNFNDCFI